ncbi:uncharacterized protein TRAVEDRAFT_60922 [Trametes versicolor FP-101664 SS1]|uniref:uncharacterized protein n=1 Tax=Trametes versicolor (strain FP-101664) TaxID=717944 RepID=UPI0004621A0E|nr:uncharacterized protein TRAVEDRAFT_60922 [Trametes versicolor FP-101664 SS1]EIW53516.1 hypothetical protein TRAVEDRAFT_60922 [Trametes versicolor FP-101664 SS1]
MTGRPTKTNKLVLAVKKRLGRDLTRDEALKLANAMRLRQMQDRVYKPRMELWDDGESATITALFELPGLGPDQVLLDVVDGRLVVQGERRPLRLSAADPERVQTPTETSGSSQIRELKYGTFRRAISVPAGCTTDHLVATLEHGMLSVSWPRSPGPSDLQQNVDSDVPADSSDNSIAPTRFGGSAASRSSY